MTTIPFSHLPFGSQLAKDYVANREKPGTFFNGNYRYPQVFQEVAPRVTQAKRADRAAVIDCLTAQNSSFNAGPETMVNLSRLQQPDCLAVVTGQQAGLLTGPLYTIYKALTTCKLAQYLALQLQRPVVPVFYLVAEDHDFEEVRWFGLLQQDGFKKVIYAPDYSPQRIPVAEILLDQAVEPLLQHLADGTPDTEFKNRFLSLLRECYAPGISFVHAFARLFSQLLQNFGVILLDASDARLKKLAQPVFHQELANLTSVQAMLQTNAELLAAGYHTQLAVHPSRPHLFILDQGRHSLEKEGEHLRDMHAHKLYTVNELVQQPERLSPKAALRPIVQDWLLPTIAYVGGPGEIAYLAQLKRVYEAFGLPMPVVVPRAGFTLVEPKIQRHLEKFSLHGADVIVEGETVLDRVRTKLLPADLADNFNYFLQVVQDKWPQLAAAVTRLDPTLQTPVQKTEAQIIAGLQQLQARVMRAMQQKETITAEQLLSISAALLPENGLQERSLNVMPFLIKYGDSLLTSLYEKIVLNNPDHQILNL